MAVKTTILVSARRLVFPSVVVLNLQILGAMVMGQPSREMQSSCRFLVAIRLPVLGLSLQDGQQESEPVVHQ